MRSRVCSLIKKNRSVLIYLIFGVLTTVVNYLVFYPCYNILQLGAFASNVIAWLAAVIFAFVTNKPFVFESRDWSAGTLFPELVKFTGTRLASGGLESVLMGLVEYFSWNVNLWKIAVSILVVIINYVGSKLLVFRKKK